MPRLELADVSLYYEVHGQGPWLVFAHGAGGNALSWWQQVPVFAPRYRCVVYDQRGWGRSVLPAPADPAAFATDLAALLDHLGAERAALVGQSMGGWAVLGCTALYPERITHLALAGTIAGLADDEMMAELGRFHASTGGAMRFDPHLALAADFPTREPALTLLYDQISGLNPLVGPEFLMQLMSLRYDGSASLRMPLRFIAGAGDRLFPLATVRAAHAKVPGADLVVLPQAGHSGYFESAAEFNQALAELLRMPSPTEGALRA